MSALIRINLFAQPEPEWDLPDFFGQWGLVHVEVPGEPPRLGFYDDDDTDCDECPRHGDQGINHASVECLCRPIAVVYPPEGMISAAGSLHDYELIDYEFIRPAAQEFERGIRALPGGEAVYLVQIDPEHAPARLKVGISGEVARRLKNYRTASPNAQVIAVAPGDSHLEFRCLRAFEENFRCVRGEVFDVVDVNAAVALFNQTVGGSR